MERPSGPPLGAATQSTGRPMVENGIPRLAPLNTARKMPNPTIQHAASNSSLSVNIPISAGQVVALAREAMKVALEENQTKAAEASGVSNELKPGVTIDLSHKQIQKFPEEVVDIIKNELERYVLSILFYLELSTKHTANPSISQISTVTQPNLHIPVQVCRMYFPAISQCSKQRYSRVSTICKRPDMDGYADC